MTIFERNIELTVSLMYLVVHMITSYLSIIHKRSIEFFCFHVILLRRQLIEVTVQTQFPVILMLSQKSYFSLEKWYWGNRVYRLCDWCTRISSWTYTDFCRRKIVHRGALY